MSNITVKIIKMAALLSSVLLVCGCSDTYIARLTDYSYAVVDTGQSKFYNEDGDEISKPSADAAFYGQDAMYDGHQFALTDNGDGTVTDSQTGLMWQQTPSSEEFTWQNAYDYCEDLSFAGYSDWRMPTLNELYSISNFSSGWPYLDTGYFDLASGVVSKDEQFWADNKYVGVTVEGGAAAAFGVNAVTGHIKAYPSGDSSAACSTSPPPSGNPLAKYVRAVRGSEYGINVFTDNEDGTVTDSATGLMWAQSDNGTGLDWAAALAYAEVSVLADYTDWRLPNIKELQSIVDYSRSPSAVENSAVGPAIDDLFDCTSMINEAGDSDYGYYWSSTSADFTAGEPYYYAWYVAFGRAVDDNGNDFHGAGGVRFDTKTEGGPLGEGGERYYNFVRLVRDAD